MMKFFQSIFNEFQIGFCVVSKCGELFRISEYNEVFLKLVAKNKLSDQPLVLSALSTHLFEGDYSPAIASALKTSTAFPVEIFRRQSESESKPPNAIISILPSRHQHSDEVLRHLELRALPLPNDGFGLCARDVATLTQKQQQIVSQKLEGIGLQAQGIAHDFNNLLSGILGIASLARMKSDLDETMAQTLDDIIRISENAKGLSEKLLSHGHGKIGHETPFDIEPIVSDMLKVVKMGIAHGDRIQCCVAKGNHFMKGDPGEISQVILNVFKNAVEAIDLKKGKVFIELHTDRIGYSNGAGEIQLRVRDDGVGMDSKTMGQMFKPFFSTKRPGRGLGMTVVDTLVEKHGGSIKIDSAGGQGTTVSITFPAALSPQPRDVPTALSSLGGREMIIIIDSDPAFTSATADYLQRYGYIVHGFADSAAAMKHIGREEAGTTNVIICELPQPEKSSGELAIHLIETAPLAKILLTGGAGDVLDVADILNEGLADFIQKPYTPRELIAKMRRMLDETDMHITDNTNLSDG